MKKALISAMSIVLLGGTLVFANSTPSGATGPVADAACSGCPACVCPEEMECCIPGSETCEMITCAGPACCTSGK